MENVNQNIAPRTFNDQQTINNLDNERTGVRLFNTLFTINLAVTVAFTFLYLTFYGLMLMPFHGLVQVIIAIILSFNLKWFSEKNKKLFIAYLILAIPTLLFYVINLNFELGVSHLFIDIQNSAYIFTLVGLGFVLAIYQTYITHRLHKQNRV